MTYSVIIPTMWRCNLEDFYKTLQVLNNENQIIEIVLIDNDIFFKHKIKDIILNNISKLKYFPQEKNIYVNPAWNLGVSKSCGEHIIIVNDDFHIKSKKTLKNIIKTHITHGSISNSIYGIATSCYIEKPTSNKIYLTDNEGRGTGWGCFFILHKNTWVNIPEDLLIWFGDDFLTRHVIKTGGTVYTFKNINAYPYSQTVSLQIFNPEIENDRKVFFEKYDK
jgi:hypothetical protein